MLMYLRRVKLSYVNAKSTSSNSTYDNIEYTEKRVVEVERVDTHTSRVPYLLWQK